jgi:hypothetical protein
MARQFVVLLFVYGDVALQGEFDCRVGQHSKQRGSESEAKFFRNGDVSGRHMERTVKHLAGGGKRDDQNWCPAARIMNRSTERLAQRRLVAYRAEMADGRRLRMKPTTSRRFTAPQLSTRRRGSTLRVPIFRPNVCLNNARVAQAARAALIERQSKERFKASFREGHARLMP